MAFTEIIYSASGTMIKPPCVRDCPDRKAACHASCEKYLEYVKQKNILNAQIRKKKQAYRDLDSREIDASRNIKKMNNLK